MYGRRDNIQATVSDLVVDFLYYDRKCDPDLPRGSIEEALDNREVTKGEIIDWFSQYLDEGLGGQL